MNILGKKKYGYQTPDQKARKADLPCIPSIYKPLGAIAMLQK
jgi:hypothetical protein